MNENGFLAQRLATVLSEIDKEKERIVIGKLAGMGIEFDFEEEKLRRFKSIIKEIDSEGAESYYYNNGTLTGIHIVTFTPVEQEKRGNTLAFKCSFI